MKRDAAEMAALSRLLDEALQLELSARSTWIESLPADVDYLKATLSRLLLATPAHETFDIAGLGRHVQAAVAGAAALNESLELKAGARIGPYELIRELGRGGMGTVWLARRKEGLTKRMMALKLPHPGLFHAELAERIARERDILENLAHPNIARIYDAGITPAGQPYLALEYIEGTPLTEYCDEHRLSVRERIGLFSQVLQAIQYAHSNLVIHRDLKPANILVTDKGVAVVLDFGIAKLLTEGITADTALTRLGGRALTPDYASPEQIAGKSLTTASDVYSLGVIFYELLTGERPYRVTRQSAGAMEEAILTANIRRPSQAGTDAAKAVARFTTPQRLARLLRGDLDTIVLTALRLSLADRYRSVDALANDVEHHLQGRAIDARAENWWQGARRFVVRNKLAVSALAAVIAALAIGLSTTLWQARIARLESEKQKASKDFVVGLFESVANNTPDGLSPASATAQQMLEFGTQRLLKDRGDDSPVRFDLLMLLGGLNEDLDLLDAAAKSIDDAVAVALRQYGEHDLRYAQALEAKAEILVRKGAYAEALKVADQALLAAGPLRPDNTALFAKTHILVGNVHNQLEPLNSPAARSHLETAYTALKATAAISDDRSRVCFYLARIWEGAGDYTKAETYYLEGIKTAETNFGPRSYIAAFGYDNFGDMLRHVHRYAESEKYVRAGLATYQTLYGPKHVNVAMSASNLALILQEQGKRAAAESMYANAVALITASRGADNILMIQLQFLQARMLLADGALQRSKAVYDAMLQTKTLYDPSNGVALLATKIDLARLQILRGDLVDAQRLVTEVAAAYAGTPDARSKRGLRLMLRQGEILTARRDAAAAAGQFKHAVELQFELGSNADELLSDTLFSASYGPLAPAVARDLLTRVNAHAGVKALRAGAKPGVDELEQLHTALGRIELAAGDLSAAQADLGAALQLRRAHDDSNSPWLAVTQRMLAEYYLARHDLPAARAALREAEKIMAANGIRSDYLQAPLQSLLARVD